MTSLARVEVCFLRTPVGWLKLCADEDALTAIEFLKDPPPSEVMTVTYSHLKEAYKQLSEYFRGERMSFRLPLKPHGTEFQQNVWKRLSDIPFGTTISYKELAARIGQPTATRAVGMANNRNPLPIVIPCHRVVGADGQMVGYAPGLDLKKTLLAMEGVAVG